MLAANVDCFRRAKHETRPVPPLVAWFTGAGPNRASQKREEFLFAMRQSFAALFHFSEKLQWDRDMCSALYYHAVTMVTRPSADLSLASEPPPHQESRLSRSTRTNYCPSFVRTSVPNHMASRLSSSFPTVQGRTCRAHRKTRHCVKKIHLSRNRHARESEGCVRPGWMMNEKSKKKERKP